MCICTEHRGSITQAQSSAVRLERRYTSRRDDHRFRGGGPASPRGKRTIPVPRRAQQRSAARRHPVSLERAHPPPEPRRADLPRPRPGALHRSAAGCSGRGRRRRTVPPADALQLERPTAGAGDFAAVAGGLPDGERRGGSDEAGAGGSGRPAGVLRVVSRLLDGPEQASGRQISASSLRARSSNPASGSGCGTGKGAKGCGG